MTEQERIEKMTPCKTINARYKVDELSKVLYSDDFKARISENKKNIGKDKIKGYLYDWTKSMIEIDLKYISSDFRDLITYEMTREGSSYLLRKGDYIFFENKNSKIPYIYQITNISKSNVFYLKLDNN